MISKTASFNIKGLACLGIACHHYLLQTEIPIHLLAGFIVLWGAILVGVFFFLSAYGLTQSLGDKRPSLAQFLKRIVRVLVPLAVIHLILYFPMLKLDLLAPYHNHITTFLGYLFNGNENPYLWFIQAILVLYLCFYISSIAKSKNAKIIICFLLITIYCVVDKYVLKQTETQYANNFPFLAGYIVALYDARIKKIFQKTGWSHPAILLTVVSIVFFILFASLRGSVLDDFSFMCLGFFGIPLMLLFNHYKCFEYRSFAFLGACSFELYIIQWYMICFMKNGGYLSFSLLPFLLYTGLCLMLAYLFSIINRYLISKYDALTSLKK